jgi:hypothetical protein
LVTDAFYRDYAGRPNPEGFATNGIDVQHVDGKHSNLFVVNHGDRRDIEVFDVDTSPRLPKLRWKGSVVMPKEMFPDGVEAKTVAQMEKE